MEMLKLRDLFWKDNLQSERRCTVENIIIRKITSDEVESAMALALEVFMQFEAPDYPLEGVATFKKILWRTPNIWKMPGKAYAPFTAHLTAIRSWRSWA